MITDVFLKRYPDLIIRGALQPPNTHAFFVQAAYIITEDIIPAFELTDNFFKTINNQLSRELGAVHVLGSGEIQHCMAFLVTPYNIMNDAHGLIDTFFKLRISFLELTFRTAEVHATFRNLPTFKTNHASNIYRTGRPAFLRNVIDELNVRFRDASIPLNYHNGLIQFAEDSLVQTEISQPFWAIVSASQWTNVDRDMKEAVDRRDNNGRDAAGYSMRALESTIKIISDLKGWTTGAEKGASNFLDNLQSKANGKFLSNWEAEMLRQMFREIETR